MWKSLFLIIILLLLCSLVYDQIVINEIMSSNVSTISDEDGDYSDWIELYNSGTDSIKLEGFSLSDDISLLDKWTFPDISVPAGEYLLVFASDKDRLEYGANWETIVDRGDEWSYEYGSNVELLSWIEADFDDSSWPKGPGGFGYDLNNDAITATVVDPTMSVFVRKKFDISGIENILEAVLHIDYDDAFVAYLNGEEIARRGIGTVGDRPDPEEPGDSHEALIYQGGYPESFLVDTSILVDGENILAIEIHNSEPSSSDLTLIPFFSVKKYGLISLPPPDILQLYSSSLHTNFKIKASGESLFLSDTNGYIIDSVTAVSLEGDISYGRRADDPDIWNYFETASPGQENSGEGSADKITEAPDFSINTLYFSGSLSVSISSATEAQIRYTLDGSPPTASSQIYTAPLNIQNSTVVKARLFKENYLPGPVISRSYIEESDVIDKSLPLISISADPDQLFSEDEGLFNNMPGELEKMVHIELYESDGSLVLDANGGMKIFGNEPSTGYDYQQSLALFARSKYGDGSFNYRLFREKNIREFEAFILRNNNSEYDLYDGVAQGLVQDILPVQAYQPVIIFINGMYWGIINMMEKINEHYLASNFSVDPDSVDLLNGIECNVDFYNPDWVMAGDIDHYVNMIDFMRGYDLSIGTNYETVKTMIEVNNFATYECSEIFFGNQDWPGNNMKWWRPKTPDGVWNWIVFDIDAGLGAWEGYWVNAIIPATEPDGPEQWPNPPWSTFILRKLLENAEFENQFIATMCDLLATNFVPETSKPWVSARANPVVTEIQNHYDRWYPGRNVDSWYEDTSRIKNFLDKRPGWVMDDFEDFFNLGGLNKLSIDVPDGGGLVKINNQLIKQYPWSGEYFEDLEVTLLAIPDIGFEFSGWEGIDSTEKKMTIATDKDISLRAIFRPIPSFERVVINEVCYYSPATDDWIELYNPTDMNIDLSGWKIMDDNEIPFIFPQGIFLNSGQYIIICKDLGAFNAEYSAVTATGNLEFGLSRRGDIIKLYNDSDMLIDMFEYKVVYPWPESGNSLSLKAPDLDNTLSNNWQNSENRKTPGSQNDIVPGIHEPIEMPLTFHLHDAYPNPFSCNTTIKFELFRKEKVIMELYNVNGQKIMTLLNEEKIPGIHIVELNGENLNAGVYYYSLQCSKGKLTKKIVLIK
jgi:hypothetical protein